MTKISLDEVTKLAKLAKLELTPEEAQAYQLEISSVLDYVSELNQVDTTSVEPTSQVSGKINATRPDEVVDYGVKPEQLVKGAPAHNGDYIEVKKVL